MKKKSIIIFLLIFTLLNCKNSSSKESKKILVTKPTVSFTFDDGITTDLAGYKFELWNQMILSSLEKEKLKAIFFVTGSNKLDKKGKFLLNSWNNEGHKIANHTFTHPYFNSEKNTAAIFKKELLQTDSIISNYSNNLKLFRFPYLKEGQNKFKVDSLRNILSNNNYSNGYVTIDASDWFVNSRLVKKINDIGIKETEIEKYKDFYIKHIIERAKYYEKLSYDLNDRHINHTLLLHHNLTSALFLGDLIKKFKEEGWEIINANLAYKDSIFKKTPAPNYAGESLIWSMAKQSGKYEQSLRHPAEDSRYEEPKMERLGL